MLAKLKWSAWPVSKASGITDRKTKTKYQKTA